MARRLTYEARRVEIIDVTRSVLAHGGYTSLSLREIARHCGMSAPGLMHYFPDRLTLLEAALDRRDEVDLAAILENEGPDTPLLEILDKAVAYYAERSDEAGSFDALEAEALDPRHPAHDYFVRRNERTIERMRAQIEREFQDGDEVTRVVALLMDGFRLKRLREPTANWTDNHEDWLVMRKLVDSYPRNKRL